MYTGEPVTQLEHALQMAQLAEGEGADAPLVVAALLHDLGHLLNDQGETPTLRGVDDKHQFAALPFLRGLFDDDVLGPIRLHVDAKRYLCVRGDGTMSGAEYWAALSDDSKRSLELQGGCSAGVEADAFIAQPHAAAGVACASGTTSPSRQVRSRRRCGTIWIWPSASAHAPSSSAGSRRRPNLRPPEHV